MRLYRLAAIAVGLLLAATGVARAAGGQPEAWGLNFQAAASPVQEEILQFHNLLLVITTVIVVFVMALLLIVAVRFNAKRNPNPSKTTHNTLIEIGWTVAPVLILIVVAIPSFRLLYFTDRVVDPEMTLLVNGYQWYWGYEYPDQQIPEYDSFIVPDEELQEGQLRLLSVDSPVVLPVDTTIEVLVTAGDVLHAWAMPSMGIKTDAVPGRQNHAWIRVNEEGTYYGQCSEICGTGHGYMPIEIRAVSRAAFDDWVVEQTAGLDLDEPPVLLTRPYPASGADGERTLAQTSGN